MPEPDFTHAQWRKSSRSAQPDQHCVEVAGGVLGLIAVRDSKDPDGPRLIFKPAEWRAFAWKVTSGELDR